MDDPVLIALVTGLVCAVASFVLGLATAIAQIQLHAWLKRRREARRASEESRRHG